MSKSLQAHRLNMQAFARDGVPLVETTLLQNMERLAQEAQGLTPDDVVQWQAHGELRPRAGGDDEVWLHLRAKTSIPLTCQRCMGAVATPLELEQLTKTSPWRKTTSLKKTCWSWSRSLTCSLCWKMNC